MRKIVTSFALVAAFTACARKEAPPAPAPAPVQQTAAPAPSQPSPQEMFKKVKAAATPGESHAKLQALVGRWNAQAKMWPIPGKPASVTKGTATNSWTLGKRFLKQDYKGTFEGQPFVGTGLLGYDNVKKEYVSTWADSFGTGIMISEGKFDSSQNAIDMTGKYSCPVTESERTGRTLTKIVNKNEYIFEMYDTGPDGKEMKTLEIVYKRAS